MLWPNSLAAAVGDLFYFTLDDIDPIARRAHVRDRPAKLELGIEGLYSYSCFVAHLLTKPSEYWKINNRCGVY